MRYKFRQNYYWTPAIAYSVGLVASDGCLQKDGRHIDLTSNDISQLHCFNEAIGKTYKVGSKFSGNGHVSFRLQFSNVAYYDFLIEAGLSPRKSHTIGAINIPDKYYPDFLRGVFDGDGTVYGYHDPRWKNSFMYYIGITSASPQFLDFIRSANQKIVGILGGSIRKSTKASTLAYAKKDSRLLYNSMYANAGNLYLPRKRYKLERFIKQDQDDTIDPFCTSGEIGKHASLRG